VGSVYILAKIKFSGTFITNVQTQVYVDCCCPPQRAMFVETT